MVAILNECNPKWAASLLSQQIWCWGQDVDRPARNWLLEIGFNRHRPPEERKDCASVYSLEINQRTRIVLRGFGVYFGDDRHGGVFLERYGFAPKYKSNSHLVCPPWSNQDLPVLEDPALCERTACIMLMLGLFDWIRDYEFDIVERLGLQYREETLVRWNNGKRNFTPACQMASSWRRLSLAFASNSNAWFERARIEK